MWFEINIQDNISMILNHKLILNHTKKYLRLPVWEKKVSIKRSSLYSENFVTKGKRSIQNNIQEGNYGQHNFIEKGFQPKIPSQTIHCQCTNLWIHNIKEAENSRC